MSYWQVLIMSVVEGITEFLPVSSTGHLILTAKLLQIPSSEFVKSFEIVIQLGAIMAVVSLYGKKVLSNVKLWGKLIAAFLPAAVIGLGFYSLIKESLLDNALVTLSALLIGGLILIGLEKWVFKNKAGANDLEKINYKQAVLIGCFQAMAIVPGVSRAAATIVGGILVGLNRKAAVEMSFLLAVPTMAAATGLDLFKTQGQFNNEEYLMLGIGFVGAWLTAMVAVRYFVKFVEKHNLVGFGVYRILLAVIYWAVFL